jgi:hypothetical protein
VRGLKNIYVDIREKDWKPDVKTLYEPLEECTDMLYVDHRAWKLRSQSDNYADVMTRIKECLKKGYTVTFWRDAFKLWYEVERTKRETLQEQLKGQNSGWRDRRRDDMEVENTDRELQEEVARLKTEIEALKGNGAKEVARVKTEIEALQGNDVTKVTRPKKEIVDSEKDKNTIRELQEEVVRLKTEIQVLKNKSTWSIFSRTLKNKVYVSLTELKELTFNFDP